jgi:hypothetical protein
VTINVVFQRHQGVMSKQTVQMVRMKISVVRHQIAEDRTTTSAVPLLVTVGVNLISLSQCNDLTGCRQ